MRSVTAHPLLARALVAMLLASGPALAQTKPPKPTAAELEEAGHESEIGNRLFTEGVFEAAVPHLQKAYDLAHKPADLRKVADAYAAMGEPGRAEDAYGKLLAAHGTALGAGAVASIKKTMATLEAASGTLDVRSTPPGAVVRVGDRALGVTPLAAPARLPVGAAHVELTKDGFDPAIRDVTIDAAHPASVDVPLVARVLTAHLSVREANPADVKLQVDGNEVGPLPWEGDVPAGTHSLAITSPTLRAEPQTVKAARGARLDVVFGGEFTASHLDVTAQPDDAKITLDGNVLGTGKYDGDVPIGQHVLGVTSPGFKPVEKQVTVIAKARVHENVVLQHEITPEEIKAQREREDAEALVGGYGEVALFGAYPAASTQLQCGDAAPATAGYGSTCSPGFVLGGGLVARGGYSFGLVGLELVGIFMANHWTDTVTYQQNGSGTPGAPSAIGGVPHDESFAFTTMGGMIGAGPRLTTANRTFRFTIGAAGGLVVRNFQLDRSVSSGLSETSPYSGSKLAISPGITGDLGIILGSTPGVSFLFGAMAWVEIPSASQVGAQTIGETPSGGAPFNASVGPFTVETGPQVYIGPYLGMRFGH